MTLGETLPFEIARVRDTVLPVYLALGDPGKFAVTLMRQALDRASRAMIEGDTLAMMGAYQALKGFQR